MDKELEALLLAAGRAPSGDNMQPWRFAVDPEARRVTLQVDESRDPSPMNAGQRMARVAVGAALENLLRTAQAHGWTAEVEIEPEHASVVVQLSGGGKVGREVIELIAARVTNRRLYDGRPVAPDQLAQLAQETAASDGVSTHWIASKERVVSLAGVIGQADALMFGDPTMRHAFLENVRFDEPPDAQVSEGLCLAALELSGPDRLALRMMKRTPDWLLKAGGSARIFAAKARQLIESAAGLCLIVAHENTLQTDVAVGRAMQRAWLALTARGLAAQPMMSLPVLENALEHGEPALITALGRERVTALGTEFRALSPELGPGRLASVLRFGFGPAPTGRTGRLLLSQITMEAAPASSAHGVGWQ